MYSCVTRRGLSPPCSSPVLPVAGFSSHPDLCVCVLVLQVLAVRAVAGSGGLHGRPGSVPQKRLWEGAGSAQIQVPDHPEPRPDNHKPDAQLLSALTHLASFSWETKGDKMLSSDCVFWCNNAFYSRDILTCSQIKGVNGTTKDNVHLAASGSGSCQCQAGTPVLSYGLVANHRMLAC